MQLSGFGMGISLNKQDGEEAWSTLRSYLSGVFGRETKLTHGEIDYTVGDEGLVAIININTPLAQTSTKKLLEESEGWLGFPCIEPPKLSR